MRQHAVASVCSIALIALASGGALSALALRQASAQAFAAGAGPFDAVLGARGSPLQLVLASLYHLEAAPGLVDEGEVSRLAAHPAVAYAIPIALGDNYRGWRIIGASPALFDPELWHAQPAPPRLAAGGRLFTQDRLELVAGSQAATALSIRLGDKIKPTHGLDYAAETAEDHAHEEAFTVVGVLAPTGTPLDRVLWSPVHAVQQLGGHDPAAAHQLSAVLLRFKPDAPTAGFMLAQNYNAPGGALTLAWPVAAHVAALFERFAWADRLMGVAAVFATLLSALCVILALQSSLTQRRRDWAILRAIGARSRTLGAAILWESLLLGLGGAAGAAIIATGLGALIAWQVHIRTGILLSPRPELTLLLGGAAALLATCLLASLWSARSATRSPVAENLAPRS
jgi:putative ABC transport system permease protein